MKAFVKTNNGTFPNVNFFLAWEAFNTMGYSVTCFEEKDIDTLEVTPTTPLFAGVTVFRKVIDKLGIDYPPFDCYPEVLKPFYGRNISKSTLGEVRNQFLKDSIPVFVKPIKPKEFTGVVLKSMLNLIPLAKKPDDLPVYVCEPIDIESEFRVYVHDGDILGVKHYYGKWHKVVDPLFVNTVVKNYKPSPIAYGVDIGVTKSDRCFVLEVNDGCNLGNYGLDSIHYGEMIVARWFEIMANSNVEGKFKEELAQQKYYDENCSTYKSEYRVEDFYNKPLWEGTHITGKDCRVKEESKKVKAESMKAFAEDVMKRLKEEEV